MSRRPAADTANAATSPSPNGSNPAPAQEPEARDRSLDDLAGALVETARALTRAAARAAGPGERRALTGAQMDVLLEVRRRPGSSVTELAEQLQLARNTVSTLVGQLTQAGLVVRADDELDARVTRLSLAPAAAARMAKWRARRSGAVAQALAGLPARDRAAVERSLGPLRALLAEVERSTGSAE